MLTNPHLRSEITTILSEDIGILAEVVFDETLETLGLDETRLSRFWAGKFIRELDKNLPQDIEHRQPIIRRVADVLMKA